MLLGIPRTLMYFRFFPTWITFFRQLGVDIVLSHRTNKGLLEQGLSRALDDVCLPIKLGFGHVVDLCNRCDSIFLPRLICVEEDAYLCPKFTGFTDMIRASIPELPDILDPIVNAKSARLSHCKALRRAGKHLGGRRKSLQQAWQAAEQNQKAFDRDMRLTGDPLATIDAWEDYLLDKREASPEPILPCDFPHTIAVLGHTYTIYDQYISMGLLGKLASKGVGTVRPDSIDRLSLERFLGTLSQRPFWTSGKEAVGSSLYYLNRGGVSGFIYVVSFECGPDSMCREVVDYQAGLYQIPMLSLVLDEHTAEAGIITRIEAFLDMLKR